MQAPRYPANPESLEVSGRLTAEDVADVCDRRLIYASLLARSSDEKISHAAKIVCLTVLEIKKELEELLPCDPRITVNGLKKAEHGILPFSRLVLLP